MTAPPAYAIVTPVRNEAGNLRRLCSSLEAQTRRPEAWVIVDNGSTDDTLEVMRSLAREHDWIRPATADGTKLERGAPIVRAFQRGLAELDPLPPVAVKLDADISMPRDHFERLLLEFERDPRLGIASGSCYEEESNGVWRQRHGTGPGVWGACRAYRRECLHAVLPLEERMGWDTLDLVKAEVTGWKTALLFDLPFHHHRPEGVRDAHRLRTAMVQGTAAHYMGYRFSYLLVRALYRSLRNPASLALVAGYARARVGRQPRCADRELRAYIREQQTIRNLPRRAREARRRRAVLDQSSR